MFLPMMRDRLMMNLPGAPDVFDALVCGLAADDPAWDVRPDAQRYTIREICGHLAALEACWLERVVVTRAEDGMQLPAIDLARLEAQFTAPDLDPHIALGQYRTQRAALVDVLRGLTPAEWHHTGLWSRFGEITSIMLEEQAMFFSVHDGYHTAQIVQWLAFARSNR